MTTPQAMDKKRDFQVKKIIVTRLQEIEQEENVKVLYACESGSRAWGFASKDSDYDIRFIYLHPIKWYLSIKTNKDVIERPIDGLLDFSGWDLKKALWLFMKSNPPLLEWLNSPIIYLEQFSASAKLRNLLPEYYSPTSCLYHYLHMAQRNYREYLKGEVVWVKKYFYVLRPILACQWIEKGKGIIPVEFEKLSNKLLSNEEVRKAVNHLLEVKRNGTELDYKARIPILNDFIEKELTRLEKIKQNIKRDKFPRLNNQRDKPDIQRLNQLFYDMLQEVWKINLSLEN
ncbi:MAG: nucleotidyltransferase domain-containing protein [Candidatus Cloacimonetes bacterium]|nr:nucleotidyltransferase domain-containing protein [Candidatus Cloacimonadota bacterium]